MHSLMSQVSIATAEARKPMPALGAKFADLIAPEDLSKLGGKDLLASDPFSSFQDIFDVAANHPKVARTGDAAQPDLVDAPDASKAAAESQSANHEKDSVEPIDDSALLRKEHDDKTETEVATTLLPRTFVTENKEPTSNGTLPFHLEWNSQPVTRGPVAKGISVQRLELPKGSGAAKVAVPNQTEGLSTAIDKMPPANKLDSSQIFHALDGQDSTKSIPLVQARAQPELQVQPKAIIHIPNQQGRAVNSIGETVPERQRKVSEKVDTLSRPNSDRAFPVAVKPAPSGMRQPALSKVTGFRSSSDQKIALQSLFSERDILSPLETAHSTSVPNLNDPTRAPLPQHIARQLVEVAQNLPSRPVEITLNPEELGRVRLSVTTSENGLVVNILAERPETLDLMRRHIGHLQQEFESLGYESVGFSFSQGGNEATDDQNQKSTDHKPKNAPSDKNDNLTENAHIHLTTSATAGLDLRL